MLFFDDVYRTNAHTPGIAAHAYMFDHRLPDSIVYRPMPRQELESLLGSIGLESMFHERLLDALYLALEAFLFGSGPDTEV